jgi:hypothetical protein
MSILYPSADVLSPGRFSGKLGIGGLRSDGNSTFNGDNEMADVEFTAMVAYVVEDFVSTWTSVQDFSPTQVEQSKAALLTVASIVLFIAVGLLLTDNADKRHIAAAAKNNSKEKRKLKNKKSKVHKICPIGNADDEMVQGSGTAVVNLDALFPSLLTEEPFIFLFYEEIKKSHRWASIYFSYDENFPRSMRFLLLVSVLICTLFFSAVLYNISDPDDGSCGTYESEGACLREPSQFSSHETKCYWLSDASGGNGSKSGQCMFKEASSSAFTVIYVAIMSALLAVPFIIVIEYLIIDVLSRPTAAPTSIIHPSRTISHRGKTDDLSVDNALKSNAELRELVKGLLDHFRSLSIGERGDLENVWGLTMSKLELYLQMTCDYPTTSSDSHNHVHIGNNSVCPVSENNSLDDNDVAVMHRPRRPSMLRRTLNVMRGVDDLSVFEDVLGDIVMLQAAAEKESVHFASMTPEQQGRRLLVLFQKDFLANASGNIMEKKSTQGKMVSTQPVSLWKKVAAFLFIALMDLGLLFYILLFAINQDKSRQLAWIMSYVVWLVIEVVVVSTLVMALSEFVVPSLMISEVKATKAKMIDVVYRYQAKLLGNTVHEVVATDFNVAPYLYLASRLAAKFPKSLESEIIRNFGTNLPKRTYHRIKNTAMDMYRKQIRITAVTLTLLSLERCLYDLLCWAAIGVFMLWQAVIFDGDVRLAVLIYFNVLAVMGVLFYCHYRTACRLRTKDRAGVIHVNTSFKEVEDMNPNLMHRVIRRFSMTKSKELNRKIDNVIRKLRRMSSVQSTESRENHANQDHSHDQVCGVSSSRHAEEELEKTRKQDSNLSCGSDDSYSNDDEDTIIHSVRKSTLSRDTGSTFTRPLSTQSLASRVRRNREAIHQQFLKKQAQNVKEAFVLSSEKRRSSIMAHQARAQSKLKKRRNKEIDSTSLDENMTTTKPKKHEGDDVPTNRQLDDRRLGSFEEFMETKERIKNYSAHQAMRALALETQQRESKLYLEKKKKLKKIQRNKVKENAVRETEAA